MTKICSYELCIIVSRNVAKTFIVMPFSGIKVTRGNMHRKLDEKGVIITLDKS